MSAEHSIHDAITEPIPLLDSFDQYKYPRTRKALILLGRIALPPAVGAAVGVSGMFLGINAFAAYENAKSAFADSDLNNEVSVIASEILDKPTRVDCNDEPLGDSGAYLENGNNYTVKGQVRPFNFIFAAVAPPVMTLRESLCDHIVSHSPGAAEPDIDSPLYPEYYFATRDYTDAIGVVLHEGEHTMQVFDEAEATCYSYQKLPGALEELGMSEENALEAASDSEFSLSGRLMEGYLSDECRPGGAFDLDIGGVYMGSSQRQIAQITNLPPLEQDSLLN